MTSTSPRRRPHGLTALSLGLSAVLALGLVNASITPAQAALVPVAGAPVAGAQTSGDSLFPHVGNGGYGVEHYAIDLAWTPGAPVASASTIAATTTITAKTTGAPLSSFSLDFEGLTVNSVTVGGQPATWTRDVDIDAQKHKLMITPATPVDGSFTTVVQYSGVPTTHVDPDGSSEGWFPTGDGATALNEPVGAMTFFPNNNTPKDKATFDISLDIPRLMDGETMAAASNGVLVAKTRTGDREKWHWRQTAQMATYLSMISIGKYEVRESIINLESGLIRDWTFIDPAITANQRNTTLASLALTEQVMRDFESRFGPYPGTSSGAIVDVLPAGYALETQDRSFYPSSVSRTTMIHEIAHQWFGNAVSPSDWSDIWLNEGAGDYLPRLFNNAVGFNNTASPEQTYFGSWNDSTPTSSLWSLPLAGFDDPAELFSNRVYTRGGMTYESLRTTVGDDVWYEIMKTWVQSNNGGDASTEDFIALASELYGKDLAPLFATWAYGTSKAPWPMRWKLDVASDTTAPAAAGATVKHTLTAANTGRVALSDKTATVDVADLLDDATIDAATLPEGLTLTGSTLTWVVPTVAAPASQAPLTTPSPSVSVTFDAVVKPTSSGGDVAVTTTALSLGTFYGARSVSTAITVQADSWKLGLTSDPASGAVEPGDKLTYIVSALNDATHSLEGATAQVDLTDVLDDATIGELPVGVTLDGTTLTWAVPTTAPSVTSTVDFAVTVGDVSSATLTAAGEATSAGGTETPTVTHTVGLKPVTPAPVPAVTGTVRVDSTLTATAGAWRAGTTLGYQWSVNGQPVAGATASTYTVRPADVGATVTVAVTGQLAGRAPVTRVSPSTVEVAAAAMKRKPRIYFTGVPKVGRTLKVSIGRWDAGVKHQFTWYRNGKKISGVKGGTYKLRKADRNKRIRVKVTTTKKGYVTVNSKTRKTVRVLK